MGFQAPSTPGVVFHDVLTEWLNNFGGIQSVINGTGAAHQLDRYRTHQRGHLQLTPTRPALRPATP